MNSQAHDDILTFSNYLSQEMKFAPGESIALLAPNHIDYATAVLGVVHMGGILTPINPLYTAGEIAGQVTTTRSLHCSICLLLCAQTLHSIVIVTQIRNSDAKVVITHPLFHATATEAAKLAGVDQLIVFGHDSLAPNTIAFEDIRGFQSGLCMQLASASPPFL